MSDIIDIGEPTPVEVGANPYNTYGLATQGFVWAAISSVSGNFDGRVKSVNGQEPDSTGNVNVSSIRTVDYSGDVNELRADLTALSGNVEYRILTDLDYSSLSSYTDSRVEEVSASAAADFAAISAASGGWNESENVVESASADWNESATVMQESSGRWNSAFSTVDEASAGWQNHVTTVDVAYGEDETLFHYTSGIENPSVGDALILRRQIVEGDGGKRELSLFEFDGGEWRPAGGAYCTSGVYDADTVFFTDNLTTTFSIGAVEVGPSGHATIPSAGKSVRQLFDEVFLSERRPETTMPTATLATTGMGFHESGTTVAPAYDMAFVAGGYEYGPASDVVPTSYRLDFNGVSYGYRSGAVEPVTLTDEMSSGSGMLAMTATVAYGDDSATPVTNLSNPCEEARIRAGAATATSVLPLASFRQSFSGGLADKRLPVDSATVRGLEVRTGRYPRKGDEIAMVYRLGDVRAVFAYPAALGDAAEIVDANGFGANIVAAFDKSVVEVADASGGNPLPYNVYVKDAALPNDVENVYTMRI